MVAGRCCQRYRSASPGDPTQTTAGIFVRAHRQSSAGINRRGSRLSRRAFHRHRDDFRTNAFWAQIRRVAPEDVFSANRAPTDKQVGESATWFFRADRKHCLGHAAPPGNAGRRICSVERVSMAFVRPAPRHAEQSDADQCRSGSKRTYPKRLSESLCRRPCRGCGAPCCLSTSIGRYACGTRRAEGLRSSVDRSHHFSSPKLRQLAGNKQRQESIENALVSCEEDMLIASQSTRK